MGTKNCLLWTNPKLYRNQMIEVNFVSNSVSVDQIVYFMKAYFR